MSAIEDLPPDQKRAYDLIASEGSLLQSELWKKLDADSRKGSRLATALADKGLIEREETVSDGRTTYLLRPANGRESTPTREGDDPTEVDEREDEGALDPRDERALSLIQERNGIPQSEFWRALDVDSRTGSRIASKLEEKGLIRREETTHDGRKTYLLMPAARDLDFSLLMAGDEISPLVGSEEDVDPIESPEFSQWVLRLMRAER